MSDKKNKKKYLGLRNSFNDSNLNSILDKILFNKKLNKKELEYLKMYDIILELDIKDYSHISKNRTCDLILSFLKKEIKVICDLEDKNGKINDEIIGLENNFEEDKCKLILKREEIAYLEDRFLYNLFYNISKQHYSLTTQDEYFEKITIDKNED